MLRVDAHYTWNIYSNVKFVRQTLECDAPLCTSSFCNLSSNATPFILWGKASTPLSVAIQVSAMARIVELISCIVSMKLYLWIMNLTLPSQSMNISTKHIQIPVLGEPLCWGLSMLN